MPFGLGFGINTSQPLWFESSDLTSGVEGGKPITCRGKLLILEIKGLRLWLVAVNLQVKA